MLSFTMEASGYGAILATPGEPSAAMKNLMQRMAAMTAKPLTAFAHEPVILQQLIVYIAPTKPAAEAPAGMVRIPGGAFYFKVRRRGDRGRRVSGTRRAVSVGGFAAAFP